MPSSKPNPKSNQHIAISTRTRKGNGIFGERDVGDDGGGEVEMGFAGVGGR